MEILRNAFSNAMGKIPILPPFAIHLVFVSAVWLLTQHVSIVLGQSGA